MPPFVQGNETLAMPHLSVPDIRWVDWQAVRRAGFEGAAFDKDNTLTLPFLEEVTGFANFAAGVPLWESRDWQPCTLAKLQTSILARWRQLCGAHG